MSTDSKKISINKKVALLLIITLIVQFFSPYTALFNTVQAASEYEDAAPDGKYLVMNVDKSEDAQYDYEDYGIVHFTLELRGDLNYSGFDVCFDFDKSILTPTYNAGTNRKPN